jgi:hypothetical protein
LSDNASKSNRKFSHPILKEITMAETTKLSVEKALNKLRGPDVIKSKGTQADEKIEAIEKETERLRAQRLRLERHQRSRPKRD